MMSFNRKEQKEMMSSYMVCDLCCNLVKEATVVEMNQICQPCAKLWVYLDKDGNPHLRKRVWKKCSIE